MPTAEEMNQTIKLIEEISRKFGIEDAYFVGGYPRSLAMGLGLEDVHDLDVATGRPGRAEELAGFVAEAGKADDIYEHTRVSTVTVTFGDLEVDFQGHESHEGARPYVRLAGVPETPIALNIFDRDFTANSLAIKIGTTELVDMTNRGIADIKAKRVITILPPDVKVPEDPLVITRAIKLAAKYNFTIDKELWKQMKKHVSLLERKLTPSRLSIEAFVLSKYPQSKDYIDMLGIKYLEMPEVIEMGKKETES